MHLSRALVLLLMLLIPSAAGAQSSESSPVPEAPDALEQDEKPVEAPEPAGSQNPFAAGELETLPRDQDYGTRQASPAERFQGVESQLPLVDRRREISSLADRNIMAPMAQTLAEGTISYSNYNLFGNYLTYAATDQLAFTAGVVIPIDNGDFITTLSGKYKVHESRNMIVSVLPFGAFANGTMELDTQQFGLGGGLLADIYLSDSLVIATGVAGFANLLGSYERYGADCTRSGFQDQSCEVESVSEFLPAGGHWLAGIVGANWFLSDAFSVNVEVILGGSWGTFFGVEDDVDGNDLDRRRARFTNPEFAAGFPHGQGPTFSLGGSWSNGSSGFQLALLLIREQDNPDTLIFDESQDLKPVPMLSAAFNF